MFDLLIKDGWIIDGTGNPWYRGDIGIVAGRVVRIGRLSHLPAQNVLSAQRRIVCPGFIDMHSHANWWLLAQPLHEPKVQQGITTELLGQDGFSLAPLAGERAPTLRQLIAGMEGDPDIPWVWESFVEYLDRLRAAHPSVNAISLVGHGTVRLAVMGMENQPPTPDEMIAMQELVRRAMEAGAAGLSTGLLYAPCYYAPQEELVALCKVVADYDGIFVVHMRSEGDRLLESIDEMLQVSQASGVSLHISHFKVFGRANWGKSHEALALLEQARAQGIDVTFDQYPYVAGSTGLSAILPPWVHEGGPTAILRRLRDPEQRERIRCQIAEDSSWENLLKGAGADRMRISWVRSDRNKEMEGKTIAELAQLRGKDPVSFALDLLVEEKLEVSMVNFSLDEADLQRIMTHPLHMVSTDSILLGRPHPRAYGSYPRILGRYVRELGLLTWEGAIRKMTSFPAQRLRLKDRGLLREGNWADLVVFDPATVADQATFEDPIQYPVGLDYVVVNGVVTVERGRHTGARAGRVIACR